jgi:cyclopropane fatty-acyl-phospholipid synthase-like methyltransferase
VLDLGCGSGEPVLRTLVARGHSAIGVDVSSEQLRRAAANVPAAALVRVNVLELKLPAGSVDAVVSLYLADHLPRERLPELFAAVRRWLRPGGWLLATFETVDDPGTVGTWLGEPMFFSSYEPETTKRLVTDAGFELVETALERQREGSREVEYLWLLARRRAVVAETETATEPPGDPLWSPPRGQRSDARRTHG